MSSVIVFAVALALVVFAIAVLGFFALLFTSFITRAMGITVEEEDEND